MRNGDFTLADPAVRTLAFAALTVVLALVFGVGLVSSGVLRHLVQTAPCWLTIYFGFRQNDLAKWTMLPVALFWLAIMIAIWLFLLGWAKIVTGRFTIIEIVMTMIVGFASLIAISRAIRIRSRVSWFVGIAVIMLTLGLQLVAFRLSLLPGIANR